ncbi:MAG TPA: endonuclease/exonuclease/phosphatase family protein [Gemmata sp.]|nr:endonuclease/exonuclease/phosphatase family protein [Gemmata sp.]
MARKSDPVPQLVSAFLKLPWKAQIVLLVLVLAVGGVVYYLSRKPQTPPGAELPPGPKTVLFCHWNMENLFDDRDDRRLSIDEPDDNWFARDAAAREEKYAKLATWLLQQNGGIGPDVIVGNEIESRRAAELLQEKLNAGLPAGAVTFDHVAMEEITVGRHIAPCVISRYPLSGARLLSSRHRILEVRVTANKYDMILIASHWTSQKSVQGDAAEGGRNRYAEIIYSAYADAIHANPKVDFLVCGDFNDPPQSEAVANRLHLTGDLAAVTPSANPPLLFGPLSNKDPAAFGTHFYREPLIYDQIGVSPGMMDEEGWGYVGGSIQVPTEGLTRSGTRARRPWRFGSQKDTAVGRGYSDHFPVMATLKVAP